jgi:hypothetical protein
MLLAACYLAQRLPPAPYVFFCGTSQQSGKGLYNSSTVSCLELLLDQLRFALQPAARSAQNDNRVKATMRCTNAN